MSDASGDERPLGSGRMRDGFDVPARVVEAVRGVRCVCGNPRLCLVTVRERDMGRYVSLGRSEAWWFTFLCLTPKCGAEHTFVYDEHTNPSHEGWKPVKAVVHADLEAVADGWDGTIRPIADIAYTAAVAPGGIGAADPPAVSPPVVVDNAKALAAQGDLFMSDLVRRGTEFYGRCSVRSDDVGHGCGVVKELVEEVQALNNARADATEELNQYFRVVQGGVRLPAPDLNQDPAFAAFLIGNLERERDLAVKKAAQCDADVTVKIDPINPAATTQSAVAMTDGVREKLKAAIRESFKGVKGGPPAEAMALDAEVKHIGPCPTRRRIEGPFVSPGPGGTEAPKGRMEFMSVRLIKLVCGFAQHLRPDDLDPKCLEMRDGGQTEAVFRFVVNGRTQVFAVAWGQDGREKTPAFHSLLACKLAAGAAVDFPGATAVSRKESGEFVVLQ